MPFRRFGITATVAIGVGDLTVGTAATVAIGVGVPAGGKHKLAEKAGRPRPYLPVGPGLLYAKKSCGRQPQQSTRTKWPGVGLPAIKPKPVRLKVCLLRA